MAHEDLTELARTFVSEQGPDASEHLAEAIRNLRMVGDARGARLLARIAEQVDQMDDAAPQSRHRLIRRGRSGAFDPST